MVSSHKQSRNLSISAFQPAIDPVGGTYDVDNSLISDNLAFLIDTYSHNKNTTVGHDSFSFALKVTQAELDDWYESGLGRHIQVYDHGQNKLIDGFVNNVSVNSVFLSASRGPLLDVNNRVSVMYSPKDVSVFPPISGATTETTIANDTESQKRYGILEAVLSGGTILDDGTTNWADVMRDKHIDEFRFPSTTDKGVSLGDESEPSVTIDVLGYYYFLSKYAYNSTTPATTTLSAQLQTILGADPNGVISTDYSQIEANALIVPIGEDRNRFADTIIKELITLGNDVDDTRRIFGVYNDQRVRYYNIPTEFEYEIALRDPTQNIHLFGNGPIVEPWNVEAGKWLFISDFLIGRVPANTELKNDPRAMFIESVSYSTPFGLSLNGIKVSELPQLFAKVGMGII